ncbi:UMP kinase [Halocatena halophila]|uniref:UMP kinase n=1 Tax=Halocatena halophila TaxID=2814576 RepID=UPI002ED6C0F9
MRAIVSVGGSVLAPDLDGERVEAYADSIEAIRAAGHDVGVVVGGGSIAREYIETARAIGANEMALDQLGIGVTRLNARLLIAALGETARQVPPEAYEVAAGALFDGDVPVMGGMIPGQTTDAVAAALAETVDAELLVFATSVDGVYSEDPSQSSTAEKFESLATDELVNIIGDIEMHAGSNAPVDLLAAKLIQRSGTRTVVLDGTDPAAVRRAIEDGSHEGTEVVP